MNIIKRYLYTAIGLCTYSLLAILIPNFLGIETNSHGITFDDFDFSTFLLVFLVFIILIYKAIYTKSEYKYIILITFMYAFLFVSYSTPRYQVIELSDQHKDRKVNVNGSESGAMNYSFTNLYPANDQYIVTHEPPFTLIHSKVDQPYNHDLEAQPDWLNSRVSGFPFLWFLDPIGASVRASINYLHFLLNIIVYFIVFLVLNLLTKLIFQKFTYLFFGDQDI